MKKILFVLLLAGALLLIADLVFSSNDFEEVPIQLEVSAYDYANEEFKEAFLIDNQEEIEDFIHSLNKSRHENGSYEISRQPDYSIVLVYNNGSIDTLRLWLDFGDGFDLFNTDKTDGHYRLKNDGAREVVREILE